MQNSVYENYQQTLLKEYKEAEADIKYNFEKFKYKSVNEHILLLDIKMNLGDAYNHFITKYALYHPDTFKELSDVNLMAKLHSESGLVNSVRFVPVISVL